MTLPSLQPSHRDVLVAAVAVAISVMVLLCYGFRLLEGLERQSIDQRFSWRGTEPSGSDIVIVAIDQTTAQELGTRPPLPRPYYAQVLDQVRAGAPRVIVVDAEFQGRCDPATGCDPADDDALLAAIARDGPVLLATHEGPEGPIVVPAGVPDAPGAVIASNAIDWDPDHVLRRMLYAPVDLKTLAVRGAEMFRNQPIDEADFPDNHAWIDFRGPPGSFPQYSFSDVMAGRVPVSEFADKAVLIGKTDPIGGDVFVTSISSDPMPGVEVHANALWTVLAGIPLKSVPAPANIALILALIATPAIIGRRRSGLLILAGSLALLVLVLVGVQLAFNAGWIITVTYPLLGLAASAVGMIAVDAYMQQRHRAALEKTFGDLLLPRNPSAFFISYRRGQNAWQARDIRRELARRYGDASVFMDTSSIDYGETFPDRIASAIRGSSVMLVLIGPYWLQSTDGTRRIDDPDDWVRREIEAGLQRREAMVIPVLLDGAHVPDAAELPEPIRDLSTRNAVTITGDDLAADIDKLVKSIERARGRAALAASGSPDTAAERPADTWSDTPYDVNTELTDESRWNTTKNTQ